MTLSSTGCALYFSQRLGSYSDLSPELRFKLLVMPLIALNCLASLVSWAVVTVFLNGYALFIALAYLCLQAGINQFFEWSDNVKNYEEQFYTYLQSNGPPGLDEDSKEIRKGID